MKVFNLCCDAGHGFEGWFASEDDYQSQTKRGLLTCPLCASIAVVRLPSAPRLNLSGAQAPKALSAPAPASDAAALPNATASVPTLPRRAVPEGVEVAWLAAVKQVLDNTEDVGGQFAEEARRIHYGEAQERGIRGQATPDEAAALHDEGIEVFKLPVPAGLKGPAH